MNSVFKKISFMLLLAAATFANVNAATDRGKKHKCNSECKPGAHMYKHGEKGHKCTEACKKMSKM
jgi:hypothetical protein